MVRSGALKTQFNVKQYASTATDGRGGRTGTLTIKTTIWGDVLKLGPQQAQVRGMAMVTGPCEITFREHDVDFILDEDTVLEEITTGVKYYIQGAWVNNNMTRVLATIKR